MIAQFSAKLEKIHEKGGWTYIVFPEAATVFGTRGAVKVRGTMDGHPFQSSFMPMGNGVQMLPVNAALRSATGKDEGDTIDVVITERLS